MTVISPFVILCQRLSNFTSPMTFWMLVLAIVFSASATQSQAQTADHAVRVPGATLNEWFRHGQSAQLVGENIRGGVSKPEQTVAVESPVGKTYQFTDYYFWLSMRQDPPGLGNTWTASLWVRVDDGD